MVMDIGYNSKILIGMCVVCLCINTTEQNTTKVQNRYILKKGKYPDKKKVHTHGK